jgi:phage terminase large subunit-like protein
LAEAIEQIRDRRERASKQHRCNVWGVSSQRSQSQDSQFAELAAGTRGGRCECVHHVHKRMSMNARLNVHARGDLCMDIPGAAARRNQGGKLLVRNFVRGLQR